MKKIQRVLLAISVIMMMSTSMLLSSCQEENPVSPDYTKSSIITNLDGDTLNCNCVVNPADTIYPDEISMLLYMREEEKLARDVYITMYGLYQIPVFNHISNSEQWHMDRVLCLLNHYGIADPALEGVGEFSNSDLQDLYNSLVEQGSLSLIDALTVGATIEDVDIFDLQEHIDQTSNEAIVTIFGHLKCGSGNHMRAFTRRLNNYEIEYTPQFISQEEYDEIISGSNGPCGNGNGYGNGNGKWKWERKWQWPWERKRYRKLLKNRKRGLILISSFLNI